MRGGCARATHPPANAAAPFDLTGLDTDPLAWLLAPARPTAFWAEAWQARPAVFPATPAREAWVSSLPTTASLVARAGGGRLQWGRDVLAAKYEGGVRTDLNAGPWGAPVAVGSLAVLMRPPQSATLQVHHPQRWDASAWRLVAALEASLGCLVGANAYLTPAGGSQGLAPHWDDVDVLVLQVEGRKAWRVYEPLPEHTLATTGPSGDLVAGGRLTRPGRLALEAVLSPGDVLYIPRGTVHQAQTLEDGRASASSAGNTTAASNHLTLSFGQAWAGADLAAAAVRAAAAGPASVGGSALAPLRRTLGPAAVYCAGYGPAALNRADAVAPAAAGLAAVLRALADAVAVGRPDGAPSLFDDAVDALAADFFGSRLPPFPTQVVAPPSPAPCATPPCAIACAAPTCFRLVRCTVLESGEAYAALVSCLGNDRETHMVGGGRGGPGREDGSEGGGDGSSSSDDESGSRSDDDGSAPSSSSASSSSSEDEENDADSDGGGDSSAPPGTVAVFPAADAAVLAAALAATRDAPLRVSPPGAPPGVPPASIPHRLAMALWSVGAVFVV